MNPRPKFCVGEEVIIQGVRRTDCNGQIHEILSMWWWNGGFSKTAGADVAPSFVYHTTSHDAPWAEDSLRKLPPKADPWKDCAFNPTKIALPTE